MPILNKGRIILNKKSIGASMKLRNTDAKTSWTLDESTKSMHINFSSMNQVPNYFDEKLILKKSLTCSTYLVPTAQKKLCLFSVTLAIAGFLLINSRQSWTPRLTHTFVSKLSPKQFTCSPLTRENYLKVTLVWTTA